MKQLVLAIGASRPRRVAEALMILWLLGAADLFFTAFAIRSPAFFYEMNPLARTLLVSHGLVGLIALKTILLGIGAVIFWHLRRFARAEIALWGLVLVHVLLIVQWSQYTAITLTATP
jgi:uncharacterized membrane protein